jgi:tRNA modification GTPase
VDPATAEPIDQGLGVLMRAPRSYTGEQVAELHCHGSPQVTRSILDLAERDGVRLADPGEFTLRAVLNGRMDLSQAESVLETITARSERGLRQALSGLAGSFSRRVREIRTALLSTHAYLEASIDYTDDEIPSEEVRGPLAQVLESVRELRDGARDGLIYRSGVRVAIIGRPNVGKSSLMNALARSERSIVTEVSGTTRDTVEEQLSIRGVPVVLVDTAGLRDTCDVVETIGIARARDAAELADLRLVVIDGSEPLDDDDRAVLELATSGPSIVAVNKRDQPIHADAHSILASPAGPPKVAISALTGHGLADLERTLWDLAIGGSVARSEEDVVLAIPRHVEALTRAQQALQQALQAVDSELPTEIISGEVTLAVRALGEITGEHATEDLLDAIFSRFCLGK